MAEKCARSGCPRLAAPKSSYCDDHKPRWNTEQRMDEASNTGEQLGWVDKLHPDPDNNRSD